MLFFKGTKKYFETVSFVVVLVNRCEPPYAAARLLDTHDTQMLLVPLLEERPWARRRKVSGSAGGIKPITEIFADGRWTEQAEPSIHNKVKPQLVCFKGASHHR